LWTQKRTKTLSSNNFGALGSEALTQKSSIVTDYHCGSSIGSFGKMGADGFGHGPHRRKCKLVCDHGAPSRSSEANCHG
jgi:hypothetical protein